MMRRLGLALAAASMVSSCAWGSTGADRDQYIGNGSIRLIPSSERGDPVRLSGVDLAGKALSTPKTSDRATVLNVWWSGCAACRAEAPDLRSLASDPEVRARFFGIDVRETSRDEARRFEERVDVRYPSFYDPGGKLLLQFHGQASLGAIPTTMILDGQMRVAAIIYGVVPGRQTFIDIVDDALA